MRAVAAADGSVGRIFEGHLNARRADRRRRAGAAALGRAGRGPRGPAAARRLGRRPDARARASRAAATRRRRPVLEGEKVFCSGAGGLDRALVLARGEPGPPRSSTSTSTTDVEIDRVVVPRAAACAPPRATACSSTARPCSRCSASRASSAASRGSRATRSAPRPRWAGIADAAADAALADLAARGEPDDLRALGAGRIVAARATIDRWLEHAAARADADAEADLRALSVQLREAIAGAGRTILDEARARLRLAPVRDRQARWTAPAATSSCSCSSTGSTRSSRAARAAEALRVRPRLTTRAATSSELYAARPDPWDFETSAYEQAKYDATIAALERPALRDRRSRSAARSACSPQRLRRALRRRCSPSTSPQTARRPRARALAACRTWRSSAASCRRSSRTAPST